MVREPTQEAVVIFASPNASAHLLQHGIMRRTWFRAHTGLSLFPNLVFRLLLTWGAACLLNAVRAILLGQIRPRG